MFDQSASSPTTLPRLSNKDSKGNRSQFQFQFQPTQPEALSVAQSFATEMEEEEAPNQPSSNLLEELNQIFYEIENTSNLIEIILRGKTNTIDIPKLMDSIDRIYEFFHERPKSEFQSVINANKTKYLEIGVKLHNKSRNLNSNNYLEIRTNIRAICAMVFLYFGDLTSKVFVAVVKLFAKCGYDFQHHLSQSTSDDNDDVSNNREKMLRRAFDCYKTELLLFENAEELQLYYRLPPLEVQEVRMSVFRCLLGSVKVLCLLGGDPSWQKDNEEIKRQRLIEELHQKMQSARSMVSSLHLRYRICLVELLFEVVKEQLLRQPVAQSQNYYTMALDILEIPNDKIHETDDPEEDLALNRRKTELEIRAYLALAFIHAENSETVKARSSIEVIERHSWYPEDIKFALRLAKLTIFLKEDHLEFAEVCLREVIADPATDYDNAISVIKRWINHMSNSANVIDPSIKITEIFKLLASRFASDPEFSSIRIAHLQTMIQTSKVENHEDKFAYKIYEIANRIVTDHCHSIHVLSVDNYNLFKNILFDQLKQHYDQRLWNGVKIWSDILIKLFDSQNSHLIQQSADEATDAIICCINVKVESLINLQQYSEALDCSQHALSRQTSTKSLLPFFKTLVYFDSLAPESVVQRFTAAQENDFIVEFRNNIEENFEQLQLCCSICIDSEIDSFRKNKITHLLLKYWIGLYGKHRYWTFGQADTAVNFDSVKITGEGDSAFLSTCCQYFTYYLNEFTFFSGDSLTHVMHDFIHLFEDDKPSSAKSTGGDHKLLVSKYSVKRGVGNDYNYFNSDSFVFDHLRGLLDTFQTIQFIIGEALKSYPLRVLGSEQSLLWVGNALCLIGCKLLDQNKRLISIAQDQMEGKERGEILSLAADYFIRSEYILSLFTTFHPDILKERVKYLLQAASARLDYCEIVIANGRSNTPSESELTVLPSFGGKASYLEAGTSANSLAERAAALIQQHFDFADDEDKTLFSTALILQFGSFNMIGESESSESFVASKITQVQSISAADLRTIIDIVESSRRFSIDSFRSLLNCAIKVASVNLTGSKDATTTQNKNLLSWLYGKAIEVSPSRKYALEKFQEFEQLLKLCLKYGAEITDCGIDIDIMDKIIAMAYNYGVTLIDLDQLTLAEQFLNKAITFVKYGSGEAKGWLSKMQETQAHIEKLRSRERQVSSKANLATIAEGDKGVNAISSRLKSPELGKLAVSMDAFQTK